MPEGRPEKNESGPGLRVAILIKQVPLVDGNNEPMKLGHDGRLERSGIELEINPFCRRAITKGIELGAGGGRSLVLTLGPASAEDSLREAIAAGASDAVLISDPAFGGSDTLATSHALAAALEAEGPFDLILAGLYSVDADTGQVAPELAELLGLPFVSGVREIELRGERLVLDCEPRRRNAARRALAPRGPLGRRAPHLSGQAQFFRTRGGRRRTRRAQAGCRPRRWALGAGGEPHRGR